MNNLFKISFVILLFSLFSCDSNNDSTVQEVSLEDALVGEWTLMNYFSDVYREEDNEGRIEEVVLEETDYGIEFTDNPKRIILSGFLRYSVQEYVISDGEIEIVRTGINFWDGDDNEGNHTGEWKIENGMLRCNDVSVQEGEENTSISAIELTGNNLKLTLDASQYSERLSGLITYEYSRK